jgi:2'-deoxynucleoside 5'-phosphate N-hydrolase
LHTDPITHPDISPHQVFKTDKLQVSSSDFLIAYLGISSFGVGMELAYAESLNIPTIILYEKGKVVSRFPRGMPNIICEIQHCSYEDALTQLRAAIEAWKLQSR